MRRCALLVVGLLMMASGCGLGTLQTAKTTPRGTFDWTVGGGYKHDANMEQREGLTLDNFPQYISLRYGVTHQLDVGARLFYLTGLVADVKFNLVDHRSPLAVSVQAGLGGVASFSNFPVEPEYQGWMLHLPLSVLVSYRLLGRLTPYAALGYSFNWIFDRDKDRQAGERYAERAGHGDGVLTVALGLELAVTPSFAIMVEYDLYKPVVDDPGDFFSFVDNHLVLIGFRY